MAGSSLRSTGSAFEPFSMNLGLVVRNYSRDARPMLSESPRSTKNADVTTICPHCSSEIAISGKEVRAKDCVRPPQEG